MKKLAILFLLLTAILSPAHAQVKTARMLDGVNVVTTNYTIQATDVTKLLIVNCASACSITLPAPSTSGFGIGSIFSVRSVGAGAATINGNISNVPAGSGTSGSSLILTKNQGADLYSSGSDYQLDGITNSGALGFAGVPSGTCVGTQLAVNTTNGNLYTCNGGTWALVVSGSTVTIQTNGVNNASQTTLNFQTSTTNAVGLTVTPSNPSGGNEKLEVTGNSYTGNAATASALASTPTLCGGSQVAQGILANGNATGCLTPSGSPPAGSTNDTQYNAGGGTFGAAANGKTGQSLVATNGAPPGFQSPGLADGNSGAAVTTTPYTIQCDSGTALIDRAHVLRFQSGASAITVPQSSASGCTGNYVVTVIDENAGALTFSRTGSDTFNVSNGYTTTTAATSFTLASGQYATLSNVSSTVWAVRITSSPTQYKIWLECTGKGLGDGTNAMPAGTYVQTTCKNVSGVTVTITGIQCFTDNNGTSTLNASGQTLGALLTGAVTCTTSYAAGTQSANVALTANDYINFTFVADGTSKQTDWNVTGTF